MKSHNLKLLALRSLKKFVSKAKEIKGDIILERLLDAEEVIIDDDGQFVIQNGDANLEFVSVDSVQTNKLQLNHIIKK